MARGGGVDDDPENPEEQLRTIQIGFGVAGTDPANHGTVTDFDNADDNVDNLLLTTRLAGEESITYRFLNTEQDGDQPITVSTVSSDTQIPTRIEIFEVNEVGEPTRVADSNDGNPGVRLNQINAESTQSAINHTFVNETTYNIRVTNVTPSGTPNPTAEDRLPYALNMNYTKAADNNLRITPNLFTLDPTNIWTDAMVTDINNAATHWSNVITDDGMPGPVTDRQLPVNVSFQNLTNVVNVDGVPTTTSRFGVTDVYEVSNDDGNFENDLFTHFANKSSVRINSQLYAHWNNAVGGGNVGNTDSHALEDLAKREFGKSLGIGGQFWAREAATDLPTDITDYTGDPLNEDALWHAGTPGVAIGVFTNEFNGNPVTLSQDSLAGDAGDEVNIVDNKAYLLYVGENALNVYRRDTDFAVTAVFNDQTAQYAFDLATFNAGAGGGYTANIQPSITAGDVVAITSAADADGENVVTFQGIPVVSTRTLPFEGAHIDPIPAGFGGAAGYQVIGNEPVENHDNIQTGFVSLDGNCVLGLADEVMTSFFEPFNDTHVHNGLNFDGHPISAISVGFLQDLGYEVDYTGAEPYTLGGNNEFDSIFADAHGPDDAP